MQKQSLKILMFIVILAVIYFANIAAFRSDWPLIVFATLIGSVVILILFPYKKFFNINNTKN